MKAGDAHVAVIALGAELTVENRAELRAQVRAAVDRGAQRVVVECSSLRRVDGSGLGVLVAARRIAREAGAELLLADPPAALRTTLELVGLSSLFPIASGQSAVADAGRTTPPE